MKDFQGQTDSHVGIDIFLWTLAEHHKRAEVGHHLGEGLLVEHLLSISRLAHSLWHNLRVGRYRYVQGSLAPKYSWGVSAGDSVRVEVLLVRTALSPLPPVDTP